MPHRLALIACVILLFQQLAPADKPGGGTVTMRDGRRVIATPDENVDRFTIELRSPDTRLFEISPSSDGASNAKP